MSYKVSIESPDWGEIELKILTREEIAKLDFEEKRIYPGIEIFGPHMKSL